MKAIIFSNGQIINYDIVKISNSDLIICCDGGIRHTKRLDIIPNYILGDLDSAPKDIVEYYRGLNVEFKSFPSHKDETDTELGLDFALSLGATDIDLYGATGTRFDHTLSNVYNLMLALKNSVKARIINENNIIQLIDKEIEFKNQKGQIVSLIPLSTEVKGVVTDGFEYPLKNETLSIGLSRGISNVIIADKAKVTIQSGCMLVIEAND